MIGNDIVDRGVARIESNWQRKGFLEKIFTPDEQVLILLHPDPEVMVWILWSMKESAYKIYNRQTKLRSYIPLRLQCSLHEGENYNGLVKLDEFLYYTKTTVTDQYIYTIAATGTDDFSNIREISSKKIIKDKYEIPYIYCNDKKGLISVSKTHHGRYSKTIVCDD